jgi:hypothetical protein
MAAAAGVLSVTTSCRLACSMLWSKRVMAIWDQLLLQSNIFQFFKDSEPLEITFRGKTWLISKKCPAFHLQNCWTGFFLNICLGSPFKEDLTFQKTSCGGIINTVKYTSLTKVESNETIWLAHKRVTFTLLVPTMVSGILQLPANIWITSKATTWTNN